MKAEDTNPYPEDIEQAVDAVESFYSGALPPDRFDIPEDTFVTQCHHGAGQFLRNSWRLWWKKDHGYKEWPVEKPAIVAYFNNIGIYHADDMSSIILTCLWRKKHDIAFDIPSQVKYYQDFWKEAGYPDGIPR